MCDHGTAFNIGKACVVISVFHFELSGSLDEPMQIEGNCQQGPGSANAQIQLSMFGYIPDERIADQPATIIFAPPVNVVHEHQHTDQKRSRAA